MNFSFGIITSGQETERVQNVIQSIESLCIPNYEILVVGDEGIIGDKVKIVDYDESIQNMWITKKKNLITDNAQYDNIVYTHDYISFLPGWYRGFLEYGDDFEICMNTMLNNDGSRFADWCLDAMLDMKIFGEEKNRKLIPYDMCSKRDFSKIMYISGAYWVAKRDVMKRFPLNEKHLWGQSEDVEWSHRVRKHIKFEFNKNSCVQIIKNKKMGYRIFSDDTKNTLLNLSGEELTRLHNFTNMAWQNNPENISRFEKNNDNS